MSFGLWSMILKCDEIRENQAKIRIRSYEINAARKLIRDHDIVRIKDADEFAFRMGDPNISGTRGPATVALAKVPNVIPITISNLWSVVGGSIVNQNYLVTGISLSKYRLECFRQIYSRIERSYYDANLRIPFNHPVHSFLEIFDGEPVTRNICWRTLHAILSL